ncbi:hypothetical protein CGRA01v4_14116 [Colletotrichum graminicola]|nr:hypothetical protein CGRA01v4_14116 [Colletotrichum graminicola]
MHGGVTRDQPLSMKYYTSTYTRTSPPPPPIGSSAEQRSRCHWSKDTSLPCGVAPRRPSEQVATRYERQAHARFAQACPRGMLRNGLARSDGLASEGTDGLRVMVMLMGFFCWPDRPGSFPAGRVKGNMFAKYYEPCCCCCCASHEDPDDTLGSARRCMMRLDDG